MHGKGHVFKYRFVLYKTEILENDAHGAAEFRDIAGFEPRHFIISNHDFACVGLFLVHYHFYKGALSGAGGTHHKDKFALVYFKVNVV